MGKTATLNIRVNPDVKENAESVLEQLGIPMATAIDMYLKQISLVGGIGTIRDTNGYCYRYVFKTNIISRRNSLFFCITKSS
ncbi:putative uncharacterized protein [Clostridium sp. CAG:127]|nr:putative uncharacterized protein [Clostridium sp. CAG:127]